MFPKTIGYLMETFLLLNMYFAEYSNRFTSAVKSARMSQEIQIAVLPCQVNGFMISHPDQLIMGLIKNMKICHL